MSPIAFSFHLCDIKPAILTKHHWGYHQSFVKTAGSPPLIWQNGSKTSCVYARTNKGLGQVASPKQRSILRGRRSVLQTLVWSQGWSSESPGRNTEAEPCDWRSPDKTTMWRLTEEKHQEECSYKKIGLKALSSGTVGTTSGSHRHRFCGGFSFKDTHVPPVLDACSAQTVYVRWFQCGNHNYLLTFFLFVTSN